MCYLAPVDIKKKKLVNYLDPARQYYIGEQVKECRMEEITLPGRRRAFVHKLRRPWDGRQGRGFQAWQLRGRHRPGSDREVDEDGGAGGRHALMMKIAEAGRGGWRLALVCVCVLPPE